MKLKYYIPFLICLISLNGFGQNNLRFGFSLGYGKHWYEDTRAPSYIKGRLVAIAVPFQYEINKNLSISSGIGLASTKFPSVEVPLGLQFNLKLSNAIDLRLNPGFGFNYFYGENLKMDFYCSAGDSLISNHFSGEKLNRRFVINLLNSISFRFFDRVDIGVSLNTGLSEVGATNRIIIDLDECNRDYISVDELFTDPQYIYRNSYWMFNLTFWNLLHTEARETELKQRKLHRLNAVYLEFQPLMEYHNSKSINYDRIIFSAENDEITLRLAYRMGIGATFYEKNNEIIGLIGLSALIGDNGHYAEFGIGKEELYSFNFGYKHSLFYSNINYRYQKNIIFFKAGANILFAGESGAFPSALIAFGLAF